MWRISTAPADLVNSFAFVNDDGQVTLVADYDVVAFTHGPEIRQGAREAVRGFPREKAAAT